MPNFDIESFKSNFEGGAKSYLFYFLPRFPAIDKFGLDGDKVTYLVKSTTLPENTLEEILTNWQGADYKMAGKYTYADFTITFNVDKDAKILKLFHSWQDLIHNPVTNVHSVPSIYMVDQQRLQLLDNDGNAAVTYILHHTWPKSIGPVTLDYATNEIATVEITFTYQYHTIS